MRPKRLTTESPLAESSPADQRTEGSHQRMVVPKPPLGPMPEFLWREKRMWHLIERLAGYANQTEHPYNPEWLLELKTRIDEVLRHNAKRTNAGEGEPKT